MPPQPLRAALRLSPAVRDFMPAQPRMDVKFPILGFLMETDATGYDLKRRFRAPVGFFYRVSDGSLYPALKKLMQDAMVTMRVERHGRRARNVYSITARGRERFLRTLVEPAQPLFVFDEAQVKVYFGDYDPAGALAHVKQMLADDMARASAMRKIVDGMKAGGASPFRRAVVELGLGAVEGKLRKLIALGAELQRAAARASASRSRAAGARRKRRAAV